MAQRRRRSRSPCRRFSTRAWSLRSSPRSEEHTSELQSHSFISYAVFCLNARATTEIYTLSLHAALPISVDGAAPPQVALAVQAFQHARVEPALEPLELGGELAGVVDRGARGVQLEGHAPHLGALFARHVAEEFHEPGEQVGLGDHHVDGKAQPEALVELLHPAPHVARVALALRVGLVKEVRDADRDEGAVQRLARPEALEELEEGEPGARIDLLLAVLRHVAAGDVEQHGLVGKPPVAVARPADALDRLARPRLLERELEPRIDERGGLARADRKST